MLAASKASSEDGATNDISLKTVREQAYASVDDSTSPPVSDHHGLQSSNPSSQTAPSQQILQTPEAQSINSAVTPIDPPIGGAIASPGASMVVAGQAISLDSAAPSTEVGSTGDQSSVAQSFGVQSGHAQPGSDQPETSSKLVGAKFQDKDVPVAHSSKIRKDLANTATATALNGFENPGQNAVPYTVPTGVQNSLPDADLRALSNSTSNAVQSAAAEASSNTVSNAGQNAAPNAILNASPITSRDATSNTAPNAVQGTNSNEAMNGMQDSLSNADLNGLSLATPDGSSNAASNTVQSDALNAASRGVQDTLPSADLSGLSNEAPISPSNGTPNAFESTAQNAAHNGLQNSFLKAVLKAFADAGYNTLSNAAPNAPARIVPNNGPDAVSSAVGNAVSSAVGNAVSSAVGKAVPNSVKNATPDAVLNPASGAFSGAAQLPVPHFVPAASTKGVVATSPGNVSPALTIPPATSPDQTLLAAGISVPAATVDQFASPAQFSSRSLVEDQAGLSGVNPASVAKPSEISSTNGKDGIKSASNDATSTKPHASSESNQPQLQSDNQEKTPSGDQGQNSSALQGQNTVRPEMNVANHAVAVVAAAQAMVNTSPTQNSAIPAGATAHTAKMPDVATSAPAAVPQALPVINTAKLIQSVGQSEMRVGMRSTEFGNISISTSSTRDLISAQISLDHGELAKTLAAHLPEIQARLGGNQPMDVRIDMNGASAGQTGTAGGLYNGSADQSRGGRQQAGNADSSSSGNRFAGQQLSPGVSEMTTSDRGFNARLDIRV
jgi:hypothetical protein